MPQSSFPDKKCCFEEFFRRYEPGGVIFQYSDIVLNWKTIPLFCPLDPLLSIPYLFSSCNFALHVLNFIPGSDLWYSSGSGRPR